jgi:3-dehydroquinate dehydratase II
VSAIRIGVIQGPNLNRLGVRNPSKYGTHTLAGITADIDSTGRSAGYRAEHVQSNHEGVLVDWVHATPAEAYLVNPAGLTAVGYSLLDALKDTNVPFAVVHISQFHALDGRERPDIFAPYAKVYIAGAGWPGYSMACRALMHHLAS